jgi:hypothetical protein
MRPLTTIPHVFVTKGFPAASSMRNLLDLISFLDFMHFSSILSCTKEIKSVSKSVSVTLSILVGACVLTDVIFKSLIVKVIWLLEFLFRHGRRRCVFAGSSFVVMRVLVFMMTLWLLVAFCSVVYVMMVLIRMSVSIILFEMNMMFAIFLVMMMFLVSSSMFMMMIFLMISIMMGFMVRMMFL